MVEGNEHYHKGKTGGTRATSRMREASISIAAERKDHIGRCRSSDCTPLSCDYAQILCVAPCKPVVERYEPVTEFYFRVVEFIKPVIALIKPANALVKPTNAPYKPMNALYFRMNALVKPVNALYKPVNALNKSVVALSNLSNA